MPACFMYLFFKPVFFFQFLLGKDGDSAGGIDSDFVISNN